MAARVIARILVMTVGPVVRAFAQAYRQAARMLMLKFFSFFLFL
jgi:hypothetical protein